MASTVPWWGPSMQQPVVPHVLRCSGPASSGSRGTGGSSASPANQRHQQGPGWGPRQSPALLSPPAEILPRGLSQEDRRQEEETCRVAPASGQRHGPWILSTQTAFRVQITGWPCLKPSSTQGPNPQPQEVWMFLPGKTQKPSSAVQTVSS